MNEPDPRTEVRKTMEALCRAFTQAEGNEIYLESRITFYLQVLKGEWPHQVNLAEVMEADLKRFKRQRSTP